MIGVLYLLLALGCWTVWAVMSARLGDRFSPLDSLLWTGLVSAAITGGGFLVHHRQLRLPSGNEWWVLAVFCAANTIACFGYYAALRHLPGILVLPVSHLYLILGPLLIALLERRALTWQQFGALSLVMVGLVLFLAAPSSPAPCSSNSEAPAASTISEPQEIESAAPEPAGRLGALGLGGKRPECPLPQGVDYVTYG